MNKLIKKKDTQKKKKNGGKKDKERVIVERYKYISTANELMQASSQASLKERTNEFMMRKLVM